VVALVVAEVIFVVDDICGDCGRPFLDEWITVISHTLSGATFAWTINNVHNEVTKA